MKAAIISEAIRGMEQLKAMRPGEDYYCETCDRWLIREEVRQIERDECCVEACRACGSTIRDYREPF